MALIQLRNRKKLNLSLAFEKITIIPIIKLKNSWAMKMTQRHIFKSYNPVEIQLLFC